jgi:hypothetical protein
MVRNELITVCGDSYAWVARCGGHDLLLERVLPGEGSLDIPFTADIQNVSSFSAL